MRASGTVHENHSTLRAVVEQQVDRRHPWLESGERLRVPRLLIFVELKLHSGVPEQLRAKVVPAKWS
jgi:hypothetical protein